MHKSDGQLGFGASNDVVDRLTDNAGTARQRKFIGSDVYEVTATDVRCGVWSYGVLSPHERRTGQTLVESVGPDLKVRIE